MAKAKVKIIQESKTGLNKRVSINGKTYTNEQAYKAAKQGKFNGIHGVKNKDGTVFIRSNPDKSTKNNIE